MSSPAAMAAPPVPAAVGALPAAAVEEAGEFRVLVFSKTAGFRHGSIPAGVAAIEKLGVDNGFDVDATEDATTFTDDNLAQYDAVIWLSTTGDVLTADQQAAFERYIQAGGGYAGIHAASDTEYEWPWYNELVGAYFQGHPAPQNADLKVEDHAHPSTAHLPEVWSRYDEWYDFRTNPRDDVHVLMSLDESTYTGGGMGIDHPLAWCQTYDGGRAWYTGGGHTDESFTDAPFLEHLLGGIRTAAGVEDADCSATQSDSFELVPLDTNTGNPMALEVAADTTVFYAERNGRVQRIDPVTQQTTTALNLPVTLGNEDGLLGLVLDPDFATNNWLYVYWAPSTVTPADGPHNRISRFTYDPATKSFDIASEKALLKITTQRNTCCHAGGDMVFDLDGNLILATGDNTNPFESDGYNPIDERAGRSDYDAQKSSANTNDLRGKIVRITPQDDGTYTVPEGNLFAPGTAKTRPEVYAMGFRNPFRIGLDPMTGNVLVGDYGPDAGAASSTRGPAATTEWNIVDEPGNYGWPYCTGVTCYRDYNFGTRVSGAVFDPQNLVNDSPNNTGLTELPDVITPEYWGSSGTDTNPFKEIGNGSGYTGAPMGGPVYQYDEELDSDVKWPAYWDNKAILGDWNAGQIFSVQLNTDETDAARNSEIVDINRILPGIFDPSKGFYRAMDMTWGPDGALYVIDWGEGFGGDNASSGIYRIDYVQANPSPLARASSDVTNGAGESLSVNFSSEGTRHPAGKPFTLEWDFGDGSPTTDEADPSHTYTGIGQYTATLTVTDEDGRTSIATINLVVGNAVPKVQIVFPESGGFFNWGDEVAYEVIVTDPDADGPIDCSKVQVLPALGHDSHQHPAGELSGCSGSIPTGRDGGHGITSNIFWVVDVRYTDDGGAADVPLTGYSTNVLNPKHFEAEFFTETGNIDGAGGVQTETTSDAGGGLNLSYVDPGDWWSYEPVNFTGIEGVRARIASPNGGGSLSMRWNSPTGPELGRIDYTNTGAWQTYQDFDVALSDLPDESGTLYFVVVEGTMNLNYFEWAGEGVESNGLPVVALDVDARSGSAPLVVNALASATDPEGGAVTLQWDQGTGDGFVAGDTQRQFIYDTPGTYLLTVRATDEQGAYRDEVVQITVSSPGGEMCFTGRSDGFDGTVLDTERWNRIVRPNQDARVVNGSLVIPASKTDIYGGGGDTPNIVLQDLPAGAWQATAKVTLPARASYQQAGLIVYGDDDNYAKMVLQARDASAAGRVFQFVREENGTANEVAASNTSPLGDAFPDTYFVRFTSDGTTLQAAYSADGSTYTSMPETKQLAGMTNPRIGLAAFSNSGSTPSVIDAQFDWFHITPDDTATAETPDDEFDGTSLDACRWTVDNPQPTGYRVAGGELQIDTTPNDIYGADTGVPNFILQPQPGEDWTVETKIDASRLDRSFQQAGLILRADDDNYVKLDIVATGTGGANPPRNLEMRSEIGGVVQNPQPNAVAPSNGEVWLRLTKTGTTVTGWHSADGTTWTPFAETFVNAPAAAGRVGLYALGNSSQGQVSQTAHFDYFRVIGDEAEPIAVSATLDPATPSGENGWYSDAVTVSVATTGGGDSTVYREVNVDGAGWVEYTSAVRVTTDGDHTVQYRASAPGQETVSDSVSFKIDALAPVSAAVVDSAVSPRTLTLTGSDATSGIALLEYRVGEGAWTTYSAAVALSDEAQTVWHRAVDTAGNVSEPLSLQVPAVSEEAPVLALEVDLDPAQPTGAGGWYLDDVTITATGTTTGEAPVTVEYSADGTTFTALGESLVVDDEGTTTLWIRATDGEYYSVTEQHVIRIDSAVPTASAMVDGRTVTLTATDATSGVDRIEYRLTAEAAWISYAEPIVVPGTAAATVTFRAVDEAGNVGVEGAAEVAEVIVDPEPQPDPTVVVSPTGVAVGGQVLVTGAGLPADTDVEIWIYSDPQRLATVRTNASGTFSVNVTIPAGVDPGTHQIVLRVQGEEVARSGDLTVTAAPVTDGGGSGDGGPGGGGGNLPATGSDAWQLQLPFGAAFLLVGAAVYLIARRRREARN
ncbi:ThuA domain-containing protein [Microbacterium sp. P07]|uniref:ThuA domain-containing protein n=1 Tax=Microbacterium sp. P07 TaxID=3366952 RepID=UPI0037476017